MVTAETLRGVHVALATPWRDGQLDEPGLDSLVERVLAGGVTGVCPLGSTGEGTRLSAANRLAVLEAVRARVPATTPVIPAPSVLNLTDTAAEIEAMAARGADAVLVTSPSYYPASDTEVRNAYETLAETAPVPIVLYNMPGMTKVVIPSEVVGALAQHPRIVGIKDSSRDFEYFRAVRYAAREARDFAQLTGSDTLLVESLRIGGAGTIAASANLVPELSTELFAAASRGDWTAAEAVQQRLFDVVVACRAAGQAGWKAALELAGTCSGAPVPPGGRPAEADIRHLRQRLAQLGVLDGSEHPAGEAAAAAAR
ncbi:MAG: dihydrodipicolinate synthase family protein [Nocardioidaceae bacterium]